MIATMEFVVVIYQGLQQPRKFCVPATFSLQFSKIVFKRSNVATLVKFILEKFTHPTPLFPVITVGPFTKWGIDFTTCNLPSAANHKYIIVVVDYFTKWAEAMTTYKNDSETTTLFLFNQVISQFGILREIVTDHGSHF